MNPRRPTLLSTYRLPTDSTLYLGDEEVAAFLNGLAALWHPAALALAAALPSVSPPHDHEEPSADGLFAVPDNPPPEGLPDDWADKARAAGAVVFTATDDRAATFDNLRAAFAAAAAGDDRLRKLLDLPPDRVGPFLGIGYGYAVLEALFEASSHDSVLPHEELLADLKSAIDSIDDPDASRTHLQSAADRLQSAREVIYPVSLFVVDLLMLDEQRLDVGWPGAFAAGQPCNVLAAADLLRRLPPERLSQLREKVGADLVEVIGGCYVEREDPLLPIESQLWNLRRGQSAYQELIGRELKVFGRRRFGFHASTPMLLQANGFTHALLISFDDGVVPSHHSTVITWTSQDGKQVEAFTRAPQPADSAQTFFHLAHYLHQTIMQDQSATFSLLHRGAAECPTYKDWLELTRFAPVLGRWVTISSYFSEVVTGDYTSPASPDDFQAEYLLERTATAEDPVRHRYASPVPISGFAHQQRQRRKIDAAHTFAAILHALGGKVDDVEGKPFVAHLNDVEDRFETEGADPTPAMEQAVQALGKRLLARGQPGNEGWLVLNPCSFIRRVALELPGATGVVPIGGPVKASQTDGDLARVVVEVPALGFAWVPKRAQDPAAVSPAAKIRLADERSVRNEFFEAEIDPQTGGLRGLRDHRTRISRLAGMLSHNSGSIMKAREIKVVHNGPALGEVFVEGNLFDAQDGKHLSAYRIRYRAWLSRPMLEMRIELRPEVLPEGYAWNSYYSARFAWRDPNLPLLRGTFGSGTMTSHTRPESPDFIDLREGRANAVIFPGGLPFHQRHAQRMLDIMLICPGETARAFDLGISLDRDQPTQTALGVTSPVGVVASTQGPPHVGAAGWLFHVDATNLLLTSLRAPSDGSSAVIARLLECAGHGGPAGFRCARNPARAFVQDLRGQPIFDAAVEGDMVQLDVSGNDLMQLRVEFS